MLPNEILLEIISFLNKNDLEHLIFTSKNIYQMLLMSETIKCYQNNKCILERSMKSVFIFKTIYYCSKSKNKKDLLILACKYGHLNIVKFLVTSDKDLIINSHHAIWFAGRHGYLEIVKFLVENITSSKYLVEVKNNALLPASQYGQLEVVKFLVANEVDSTCDINSAVYLASRFGHLEVAKFLVAHGADITVNNNCAVCLANHYGHLEVVKFLLENGANLTDANNYIHGTGPWHFLGV